MRGGRLVWRIFFAHLAIVVTLIAILGLYGSYEVRQFYLGQKAAELEAGARIGEARIEPLLDRGAWAELQRRCEELGQSLGMRITVILPSGKVVGESSEDPELLENHAGRPEIKEALAGRVGRATRPSPTLREEHMYRALPVRQGGTVTAVVRTSFPIQTLGHTLHAVYLRIAVAGLVAAGLVAAAGFAVARRIVRPLEAIRAGVERFARGNLEHRLPVSGAVEIRMVAQAMNQMAEQLNQRIQTIVSQQNQYQAVLSSMEEGVLAVDEDGRILSLNETCARLLGVDPLTAPGRLLHEIVRRSSLLEFVDRILASPMPIEEDFELSGPDRRLLHVHGTVLHDAQERRIGALLVLHDMTRLRHLENVRRDFVANVSHELRTPITSIKGFVETLLDEGLEDPENSLRFLRIVLKQVNRLDAIIADLLLLSRVERGSEGQTIELAEEPIAEALRAAVEMCERKARDKGIAIEVQCPADLTARINAPLLEQAIINLLDNAIKYSDPGRRVRITAGEESGEVVLRVQDEGCGIAPLHLPRLFERFYRVDKARSRELGGTGLGLAIVKHIVAAHRGTVRVESEQGRGSTFSIHLPSAKRVS